MPLDRNIESSYRSLQPAAESIGRNGTLAMRAIFISYRRNDTEGEAGRLFDDLIEEFGEDSVFMDVTTIEAGRDFRKVIDESVATCGVLLAIIGKNWLDATGENGKRRLDDPLDFVRLETVSALRRDIPVIPVIVRGATMPHADQLPEDLRDLAYRNSVELTHVRWSSDLQLLIAALRRQLKSQKTEAAAAERAEEAPGIPPQPIDTAKSIQAADRAAGSEEKNNGGGTRRWPLFLGIGVCAVVAIVAGYLFFPRRVTVPDVRGDKISAATAKLDGMHLKLGRTTIRSDASQEPDVVLSQFPPSDEQVSRGTAVDLVVSGAIAMVEVPALTGKSLESAQRLLSDRQLNAGDIQRQSRAGVARDTVLQQFPQPGEAVKSGAKIDLLVADIAPSATATIPTAKSAKAEDDQWAAQRAAAKHAATLKAAAEKAAAEKLAASTPPPNKVAADQPADSKPATEVPPAKAAAATPAPEQAARPQVIIKSATCTTLKPGQYRVDVAGDAYAPAGDTYLFYTWAAIGSNGTRWRPECKSWSVPQFNDDPLWEVTCIHRPNDAPQTAWQTSRVITSKDLQPPTNGGTALFKPGVHSASTLKFNLACK
jgi:beta-lactam-binding protein with PASTA domain